MGFLDKLKFWKKRPDESLPYHVGEGGSGGVVGPPEPDVLDILAAALDAREDELQEQIGGTESPQLRAKLTARVSEVVYLRDEVRKAKES